MNNQEVQKILRAWDECCELKTEFMSEINVLSDGWVERVELCCEQWNANLDEIIDILEDWAAEYSATWTNFECQEEDNEVIDYELVYSNYLCQQEDDSVATTTSTSTSTTTINPFQIDFEILYDDYMCMMIDDPTVSTTTTVEKSGQISSYSATWEDYLCEMENNPSITTTTTTFTGTTTTSTTVDPEDVTFLAIWEDFLCKMDDNPLLTTTTSTTTINEDDVDFDVIYSDYLCMMEDDGVTTTTTSTPASTTTTTTDATTTTTTISDACPVIKSGGEGYYFEYNINLGSGTGQVTLNVNASEVPNKFIVEWGGSEVINTSYRGDSAYQDILYHYLAVNSAPMELIAGASIGTFTFNKTTADPIAAVRVYAPIPETIWSFTISCPTSVSTTTTTSYIGFTGQHTDFLCQLEDDGTPTTSTTSTTLPVTTTTTTISVNEITCGQEASGGTNFPLEVYIADMGAGTGYVTLKYDMNDQPDKFVVEIDGLPVLDTGYRGDVSLQSALDAKLASYGLPSEPIIGNGTGTASFFKDSATTIAVIKVYAPLDETLWSFTVTCPDGSTSTTSTTTTTIATTTTTTVAPVTTTTTTNAAPISVDNALSNRGIELCNQTKILVPADFTFTDTEGDTLQKVKITSYSLLGAGTLTYNGVAVTDNQVLTVFGGASGSFQYQLLYTPDLQEVSFADTINFVVKTKNNENYG